MPNPQCREYPRRPKRLEWLFSSVHPFYFVTLNTYERHQLLARPEIHDAFRSFCLRAQERNVAVGRYVLMPDHVHLFVALHEPGPDAGKVDSSAAVGHRQAIVAARISETALAGRFL